MHILEGARPSPGRVLRTSLVIYSFRFSDNQWFRLNFYELDDAILIGRRDFTKPRRTSSVRLFAFIVTPNAPLFHGSWPLSLLLHPAQQQPPLIITNDHLIGHTYNSASWNNTAASKWALVRPGQPGLPAKMIGCNLELSQDYTLVKDVLAGRALSHDIYTIERLITNLTRLYTDPSLSCPGANLNQDDSNSHSNGVSEY